MEKYKQEFAEFLAGSGALFFDKGLMLKDGRPTPYFVNMGKFSTGELSYKLGKYYAAMMVDRGVASQTDIIFGPSYKGSAIAQATAISLYLDYNLNVGFCYDRKEAKTHGEASTAKDMFVGAKFFDDCKVYLVDDVGTSMATKKEALDKIAGYAKEMKIKVNIIGIGIGVDREQTTAVYNKKGKAKLNARGENAIASFVKETGIEVHAVAGIKELVDYLAGKKFNEKIVVTEENKKEFDEYIKIYGVD